MPKSHLKLMGGLAALVLLVVLVSGVLAERGLRQRERARIERSLEERAQLVRALVARVPLDAEHRAELDALADRAAEAAGARVTLIGPDGAVHGDSDVSLARLGSMANHVDRPEVREALAGRVGQGERRSQTVKRRLFYLALPVDAGRRGVVRLAVDLSDVEAAVSELRGTLLTAGAVGLAAALALSYALAWLSLRPLRELRRVASSIARGDLDHRIRLRTLDEVGDVAHAINRLAEQLRLRLGDVTREKEQLKAVLDGMVEGVLVVDGRNEILLANERMRDFFAARGELRGRTPLEAIRDKELDQVLEAAERTEEAVSRTVSVAYPTQRMLQVHAVRFPRGPGPRLGTVAVFHDVTELKRLEKVRQDFVANASHELRTPLAAIRGFTETLLQSGGLPEEKRQSYLGVIDRHSRRLANIVADLLDLSKIESQQWGFDLGPVDVRDVAETLLRDASEPLARKGLEAGIAPNGAARAWADRRALEQILGNLLDNAVKYTEAGGRIEVRIGVEGDFVQVAVADTGIGIPPQDLDRIFERFYRVDKARSRELGGTGLGLSIVKHLVQSLGGEIHVESELARGSTFRFRLPRAPEA